MYAKYFAFFEIAQALILNFLQSRLIPTFYERIKINGPGKPIIPVLEIIRKELIIIYEQNTR